jgi:hypothetical protein
VAETIHSEMSHRKTNRFGRMPCASGMAHRMQVRDFIDYAKFPTQTVSEQRVHDIIPEAMAQSDKHDQPKPRDAETRPHNICLAEQRMTERY